MYQAMKYTTILFALFLGLFLSSCVGEISESQSDSFMKMYGSGNLDQARGIVALENGGYAFCGTDSSSQGTKMMLVVTDSYGNLENGFPKFYPEESGNAGANAIVAKNGGQGGFLLSGFIENERGDRDIYLVKVSSSGTVNWSESYGSVENEEALHATEGIKNEFVLAGYQEKNGEKDIMIMAVDQEGDSIDLSLNYNKPHNSKDAAANFILNTGDNYLCVCTYNKFIGEGTDILVLNFDDDLSPNDDILGGQAEEFSKCIVQEDADNYIVLGNRENSQTGKSEILLHLVETDGLLVKESSLLATISEAYTDLIAERLVKIEAGKYAIVGTRRAEGDDIFIQFLENYQIGDRITLGGEGDQSGADIVVSENGGLVVLGDNYSEGSRVISLIKTDESGNF